jgi:hypothetical protein
MKAEPVLSPDDAQAGAERVSRQLAWLEELGERGMGLARSITLDYRGDPVLAFTRISRCIRLIMFMEMAVADGRYAARMAARAEASAAPADAEPETDGDEAEAGEGSEGERLSRDYENLDETRVFSRWLDQPLDEVIGHIRGQFAMVERGIRPADDAPALVAASQTTEAPQPLRSGRENRSAVGPPATPPAARPGPP